MTEQERWAWLGGFMDGEGSFYPILEKRIGNRVGFRMGTVMDVSNTNQRLLAEVMSITGGGRISKCRRAGLNDKESWKVHFSRPEILSLIPKLMPYLIGKNRQAEIILEMATRMNGRNVRYTQEEWNRIIGLYNECRTLNKRGLQKYIPIEPSEIRPARYVTRGRCSVELCNGLHYGHGYCRKHYRANVEYPKRNRQKPVFEVISAA